VHNAPPFRDLKILSTKTFQMDLPGPPGPQGYFHNTDINSFPRCSRPGRSAKTGQYMDYSTGHGSSKDLFRNIQFGYYPKNTQLSVNPTNFVTKIQAIFYSIRFVPEDSKFGMITDDRGSVEYTDLPKGKYAVWVQTPDYLTTESSLDLPKNSDWDCKCLFFKRIDSCS